jgi:hypothetical protein
MKSSIKLFLILVIVSSTVISPCITFSQNNSLSHSDLLTIEKRSAIVNKIRVVFNEYYPLPDVAKNMINYIDKKLKEGEYKQFSYISEFTSQLTEDLRFISNDQHIRVTPYEKIPDDLKAEIKLGSPEDNYGFQKVEHLLGNIGYINLTSFNNPRSAGPTAIAAMNFVANCDALIIDLRLNGGGDEAMAQFLSSYFFDKSTHLTDYYIRKDDVTEQIWTQEWVPGPRMTKMPIYILLSSYSYSSSEVLAYQLQQLKRAVIIGEKTKGGVHGVRYMSFPEFSINLKVPYSSEINPYSKTNYINGIIPDVPTSSDKAFIVANIEASKKLLETELDSTKRYKLEWVFSGYEIDNKPLVLDDSILNEFVGMFENVHITLECGKLFLKRSNQMKQEMVPMGKDLFKYKDFNEEKYRVQFIRDGNAVVTGLYDLDSDGDKYPVKKRLMN